MASWEARLGGQHWVLMLGAEQHLLSEGGLVTLGPAETRAVVCDRLASDFRRATQERTGRPYENPAAIFFDLQPNTPA
ncbi:hypothetical protein OH768_00410 [Streptomyces sp. NBC_01622]|uniref:hypothetical protein n=1 Tax=Streptomyces sp. NBC_01622 TaxID=2975903 RepID=UPI003862DA00|nr:hypothetical protein OH768_00410 [Streptomyces sp. NBC_01622]